MNKMEGNYITLKWGTLKSWRFENCKEADVLFKEFDEIEDSGIMQQNTPRQKEIICGLIDLFDGEAIYLAWDGKDVSKEKAKEYVMNYDKEDE